MVLRSLRSSRRILIQWHDGSMHGRSSIDVPRRSSTSSTRRSRTSSGPRNHSPTDRPEHFAHANTAQSLIAVWLADNELGHERRLLRTLGATLSEEQVRLPEPVNATVAHLPEGDVVLLPGSRRLAPGRRIVGATVRSGASTSRRASWGACDCRRRHDEQRPATVPSLFLSPDVAHGLWLELGNRALWLPSKLLKHRVTGRRLSR